VSGHASRPLGEPGELVLERFHCFTSQMSNRQAVRREKSKAAKARSGCPIMTARRLIAILPVVSH
jgi:hypothetical protein